METIVVFRLDLVFLPYLVYTYIDNLDEGVIRGGRYSFLSEEPPLRPPL